MRQNKACKGAAGCLQRATSFTGAVLPTEEQCSKGHWQLPAGRGDCLLGGAVNYCPFTRVTMMFLFVFLPLSRGILAELLSIMLNNWQRRLSGKHLSHWSGAVGRGSSLSPQWCSDSVSVYPKFAVWGTELPTCLYSSQLPSCSEVGTAPGRQLNRLKGSAGKWFQLCGRASFETQLLR